MMMGMAGLISGMGELISMIDPRTNETIPPTPSMPNPWILISATKKPMERRMRNKPDIIDGQDLEGQESQQQRNAAQDAGDDHAGMGEFDEQADQAEDQQEIGQVGVGDRAQEFLPFAHFQGNDFFIREGPG